MDFTMTGIRRSWNFLEPSAYSISRRRFAERADAGESSTIIALARSKALPVSRFQLSPGESSDSASQTSIPSLYHYSRSF